DSFPGELMIRVMAVGLGVALWLTSPAAQAEGEVAPAESSPTEVEPDEPVPPRPEQTSEAHAGYVSTVTTQNEGEPPDMAVTGTTATTVTRERLEALPGGDTQPVTNYVAMQPGVVQDSYGHNLHVRGADGALTYVIDGIPLISPSVGTVGQLLNTIPTRLVQSVDVLTGGFPVQYSYSLGGIVNIQTRKPTEN